MARLSASSNILYPHADPRRRQQQQDDNNNVNDQHDHEHDVRGQRISSPDLLSQPALGYKLCRCRFMVTFYGKLSRIFTGISSFSC
jgi:hypothetical protein